MSIQFKASFSGYLLAGGGVIGNPTEELITVEAKNISTGLVKAARQAFEIAKASSRELCTIDFYAVLPL